MEKGKQRREFLKDSALAVAGGVAASSIGSAFAETVNVNPSATTVMPNGQLSSREEVLRQLGLNANTPPDAWLAIFGCGANAAGLTNSQRQELERRGLRIQNNELLR